MLTLIDLALCILSTEIYKPLHESLNLKDGLDVSVEGYLLCTANRIGSLDYYLPNRIFVGGYGLLGVRVNLDDIWLSVPRQWSA
jgi:hypothetical protein